MAPVLLDIVIPGATLLKKGRDDAKLSLAPSRPPLRQARFARNDVLPLTLRG